MKCICTACCGGGTVKCRECDGIGEITIGIDKAELPKSHKHFDELSLLQKDARRAKAQAERLKELNPKHAGNYTEQLLATLAAIEKQAARLLSTSRREKP